MSARAHAGSPPSTRRDSRRNRPVRGDLVEPVIDENTKLPVAWRLSVGSQAVDYPDHAVAQFAEVDPYNPMRGVGPMQAAFRTATKDFTCDRYDDALLKNGGSPGGVLSSTQPLTEQQLSVIRNSWNEGGAGPRSTARQPSSRSGWVQAVRLLARRHGVQRPPVVEPRDDRPCSA